MKKAFPDTGEAPQLASEDAFLRDLYRLVPIPTSVMWVIFILQSETWICAAGCFAVQVVGNVGGAVFSRRFPWIEKGNHFRMAVNAIPVFGAAASGGPDAPVMLLGLVTAVAGVFSTTWPKRIYSTVGTIAALAAGMAYAGADAWSILNLVAGLSAVTGMAIIIYLRLYGSYGTAQRLQQRTEQQNHQLELALSARQSFLATMSHEVRTPLNAVLGMAQLLHRTPLEPKQQEMLQTIQDSGAGLLQILNDILDTAKLDAGKVELERIGFSPAELVQSVARLMRASIHDKDLAIVVEHEGLPPSLEGDPARLRQVLLNLVGNAVKFTQRGEIRIRASWDGQRLRIEVHDTGIGISQQALRRLFEPFSQAESGTTRRFGGTGLGLAICQRLITLMDGEMTVLSTVGEGSCFAFEVPAAEHLGLPEARHPTARSALPERVLLVDDNPVNLMVVSRMLEHLGVGFETATDGIEALERLEGPAFDLVLMDCRMPRMDGFEATRRLRVTHPTLRVVALTAGVTKEEREACAEAGMDAVLAKPVALEELQAELSSDVQERATA